MNNVKILVLEHDPDDVEFLLYELKRSELVCDNEVVANRRDFERALRQFNPDIVLSDYSLPAFDGLTAYQITQEISPSLPFIILSGTLGEEKAVELIKMGVTDYVIKEKIYQIVPKINRALKEAKERKENELFDQKLKDSEEKYRQLFHLSPIPMWVYDPEIFRFLDVNKAAVQHYGYSLEEFFNMTVKDIRPKEDVKRFEEVVKSTKNTGIFYQNVFRHKKKSGEVIKVNIQSNVINYEGKKVRLVLATDITDRLAHMKAIEDQNEILRKISWTQSHIVRAPLARIMGLINCLNSYSSLEKEVGELLDHLRSSAKELDEVIRKIVENAEKVNRK